MTSAYGMHMPQFALPTGFRVPAPFWDLRSGAREHEAAAAMIDELRREQRPQDARFGPETVVIGKSEVDDDILVTTDEALWVVRLTWKQSTESPGFPAAWRFDDIDDFNDHLARRYAAPAPAPADDTAPAADTAPDTTDVTGAAAADDVMPEDDRLIRSTDVPYRAAPVGAGTSPGGVDTVIAMITSIDGATAGDAAPDGEGTDDDEDTDTAPRFIIPVRLDSAQSEETEPTRAATRERSLLRRLFDRRT